MPRNPDIEAAIKENRPGLLQKYLQDPQKYGPINAVDDNHESYLHLALAQNYRFSNNPVLETLLANGIDHSVKNGKGETAFNPQNVNYTNGSGCSFACAAAMDGCPALLSTLVFYGANIYCNYADPYINNPLMAAVGQYRSTKTPEIKPKLAEIIKFLLKQHAGILLPIESNDLTGIDVSGLVFFDNKNLGEKGQITTPGTLITLHQNGVLKTTILGEVSTACQKIADDLTQAKHNVDAEKKLKTIQRYLQKLQNAPSAKVLADAANRTGIHANTNTGPQYASTTVETKAKTQQESSAHKP